MDKIEKLISGRIDLVDSIAKGLGWMEGVKFVLTAMESDIKNGTRLLVEKIQVEKAAVQAKVEADLEALKKLNKES